MTRGERDPGSTAPGAAPGPAGPDGRAPAVAIVTGAGRPAGIAAAIARALAADGYALLLTTFGPGDAGRGGDGAAALLRELRGAGARAETLEIDLALAGAPERVLDAAAALGSVTALAGCAAVSERDGPDALTAASLDRHFAVNARAHALLATGLVRRLPAGATGRIVLLTSGQGVGPMPLELAYAASKGALEALVTSLAPAFAARGAWINALDPGATDTGWMTDEQRLELRAPDGRVGGAEDAARVARWLLSPAAERVTGQVVRVRGGA